MIFGIGFYSYMIGNMTNLIASMDSSSEELMLNISILKEFKKRTRMPNRLFVKIKRHLENNSKASNNFTLQDKLLNDLPLSLRSQVIACTHGMIIDRIHFFKNKNQDFLMSIMIELKPLRL
jgi:potassium channel